MIKRDRRPGGARAVALGILVVAVAAACGKKDEPSAAAAPAASAVAPSVAAPGASIVKYSIDPAGKTSIDMPAPAEHIKAETSASTGELQVDLMNLSGSRGEVKVDVSTLKTHTFDDPGRDTKQTEHAITWLEVGDKAPAEAREKNRWATFAIRSIEGASASDLTKVTPVKSGEEEVRSVTLTAHGDFLLHGHKVDKDAALEVRFHYPAGAPANAKPVRLDVATKSPLHIVLAEHEVKPRDNLGSIAQSAFGLLGTKVAETADVTLDLHATAQP